MARRTKQIVWHKRQQKFISSTLLKPHAAESPSPQDHAGSPSLSRREAFAQDLMAKIRKAVRG